jgi:general secretion pathway protein I
MKRNPSFRATGRRAIEAPCSRLQASICGDASAAPRITDHQSPITACSGFSLIELLVAMAVFALVVMALLNLAGESTRTAARIEERVLAGLVAQNVSAEAMLVDPAALSSPVHGVEELGGQRWRWLREAQAIGDGGDMLGIRIRVAPEHDDRVAAETNLLRAAR